MKYGRLHKLQEKSKGEDRWNPYGFESPNDGFLFKIYFIQIRGVIRPKSTMNSRNSITIQSGVWRRGREETFWKCAKSPTIYELWLNLDIKIDKRYEDCL